MIAINDTITQNVDITILLCTAYTAFTYQHRLSPII